MDESTRAVVARKAIDITGIVQGVGFRPFVYRLAQECNLTGFIANTPAGVTIEVQGERRCPRSFPRAPAFGTPSAGQKSLHCSRAMPSRNPKRAFRILSSRLDTRAKALISPDVAVCTDCLREMMNPRDRRFRYPFINCTNCGPRFTIVRDIPYDRARTSMSSFQMCAACQAEYDDPANRRFHAQPNACWDCGPQLLFCSSDGCRSTSRNRCAKPFVCSSKTASLPSRAWADFISPAMPGRNRPFSCSANGSAASKSLLPSCYGASKTRTAFCMLDDAARKLLLSHRTAHRPASAQARVAASRKVSLRAIVFWVFSCRTPRSTISFSPAQNSTRSS